MIKKLAPIVVLILLIAGESRATLWNYSGSGSIADKNGGLHELNATMIISDLPRFYSGYDPMSGTQGSPIPLPTNQSVQIYYQVAGFQLSIVGNQTFFGDGLIFGWIDPFIETGYVFTDEWQLSADIGGQTQGLFMDATFPHYDTDGSAWEFRSPNSAHYGNIGPEIDMGPALWTSEDGVLGSMFSTFNPIDLIIKRDAQGIPEAPIPEPATWILVATGLIGFTGWRKRKMADRQ